MSENSERLITRTELAVLVLSSVLLGLFLFIDGDSEYPAPVEAKAASSQPSSSTGQALLACATPAQACQPTEASK